MSGARRSSPRKRPRSDAGDGDFSGDSSRSKRSRKGDDTENETGAENENTAENENENNEAATVRRAPKPKKSMKELCREWNQNARIGFQSETARGWLKKMKDLRRKQGSFEMSETWCQSVARDLSLPAMSTISHPNFALSTRS